MVSSCRHASHDESVSQQQVQGTSSTDQVLQEDVAAASLAEGRVALGDHDAARLVFDEGVVELLKSSLG